MMQFISSQGIIKVPLPITNKEGKFWSHEVIKPLEKKDLGISSDNDSVRMVCLLEYIPGEIMKNVPYTKELLIEVGKYAGTFYQHLKRFSNDGIENRKYIWNLLSVPDVHEYLFAVENNEQRSLVENVLKTWNIFVVPILPSLEKGIIHGDINEQNILVKLGIKTSSSEPLICGVLDFGDACFAPVIFELAIAITYVLVESDEMDFVEAGGYVISGYTSKRALTASEWDILKECVGGRLAQSLILGAHSYYLDPSNNYVLCSAKRGWPLLEKFWSFPKEDLIAKWKTYSR